MAENTEKEIILFDTQDGISFEVNLKEETVWLSQKQMAKLFKKNVKTVNEHINNIFKERELNKNSVIRNFRITATDGKKYKTKFYNLDIIISVGYRVKSKTGTKFRIWANKILKDYLTKGYTVNQKKLKELQQTIKILKTVVDNKKLKEVEATGLLKVITDYNYALSILDKYDSKKLKIKGTTNKKGIKVKYSIARKAIDSLKEKLGETNLFGNEKDKSFKSSLGTIHQSFDGNDLYPSIEEKAAHLLYFIVKNHSFTDGNKRIAAFLFIWFLDENKLLYGEQGVKRIANNTLVALTLMIAQSNPKEKSIMTKVIVSLINKEN